MDPKYYEDEFVHTAIKELEYVRTPFYDLAKYEQLKEGQDTSEFLEEMRIKMEMINPTTHAMQTPYPTKENVAFTRYADEVKDPEFKERLQFPMGQPYRIIESAKELFRVQKTKDHWATVTRSKQFLARDFFPPR